jgi:hypothetical protein
MNELYHQCYWNLQRRWHMDLPIIDYNLARLKKLAEQHGVLFTFNDWPLALEFYLQVDGIYFTSTVAHFILSLVSSRSVSLEDIVVSWSNTAARSNRWHGTTGRDLRWNSS